MFGGNIFHILVSKFLGLPAILIYVVFDAQFASNGNNKHSCTFVRLDIAFESENGR